MSLVARACSGILTGLVLVAPAPSAPEARPRARDLGLSPGVFPPGTQNAITDVAGVRVGQVTLVRGESVRTGVTAILPHGGNLFQDKVAGAIFVGNAFGKLAGSTQVEELGTIETPIVLTNTLAVGTAMDAVVRCTLAQAGNEGVRSVNAVVGETNDGWGLNDIRSLPVTREHVLDALRDAREGAGGRGLGGRGHGHAGASAGRAASARRRGVCPKASSWACWCRPTSAASWPWTACPWARSWAATTSPPSRAARARARAVEGRA